MESDQSPLQTIFKDPFLYIKATAENYVKTSVIKFRFWVEEKKKSYRYRQIKQIVADNLGRWNNCFDSRKKQDLEKKLIW